MEQKICADCGHYVQYYRIQESILRKVSSGHCAKTFTNGRFRTPGTPCEFWMQREEQEKINLAETLKRMAQHVEEIALIFKKG